MKVEETSSILALHPKVFMKFFSDVRDHIIMIRDLIRYKDYLVYKLRGPDKKFAYDYTWYDGPHYMLELWFFGIALSSGYGWDKKRTLQAFLIKLIKV